MESRVEPFAGQSESIDDAFARLYEELRAVASRIMRHERPGHTLRPTGLLNEAFLKLRESSDLRWNDDAHFRAIVARNMGRILRDHARTRGADKRTPDPTFGESALLEHEQCADAVREVHRALDSLAHRHRDGAYYRQLIVWKDVLGLTQSEVGLAIGRSERTVRDHLAVARACLAQVLSLG